MKRGYETLVAGASVFHELAARREFGLRDRLAGFLALVRPLFFVLTPVNAAGAAVLALGGYPTLLKGFLGFFAVAFASCAVNVFNDYTDRERDRDIWPTRPIPSGRVRPGEALAVAAVSLAISLAIAWLAFNPITFSILLLAIVLGGFYSAYLRDRVGYLSLPPIVGLIYLGGWVAFSPETLFSSVLPWYLYLLGVVWQTAHIMIYYPLHVVPGSGSRPDAKAPPAFFFTPSSQTAVKIGGVFTGLTLLLSAALLRLASLNVFYLVLVVAAGAYALVSGWRLNKDVTDRKKGLKAFTSLSVFRLVISAAILLSVFLAQV
ncbi:MAG: UbiA prenyltransferase family protein [Chloroflexota bacterium]